MNTSDGLILGGWNVYIFSWTGDGVGDNSKLSDKSIKDVKSVDGRAWVGVYQYNLAGIY